MASHIQQNKDHTHNKHTPKHVLCAALGGEGGGGGVVVGWRGRGWRGGVEEEGGGGGVEGWREGVEGVVVKNLHRMSIGFP